MTTSLRSLVPVMIEKTHQGKIKWEYAGANNFTAQFPDYVLRIEFDPGSESVDYQLHIVDQAGNIIETYTPGRRSPASDELANLYELARRQALKVDKMLDDLERRLKDL